MNYAGQDRVVTDMPESRFSMSEQLLPRTWSLVYLYTTIVPSCFPTELSTRKTSLLSLVKEW